MLKLTTREIRSRFLDYFRKQGHEVVPSSPVVPHQDPTLLFINAGMNQFKDVFLGESVRSYTRAVTSQKCVRAGGKHNDLENVGHTARHMTFFEMMGNFSFGDYFKEEAIRFAWEVSTQVFKFPEERIWPTVYTDDDEAFELWRAYVPEKRITRFGAKENFWAMGDTGPCGPCSELLFDRGPQYGTGNNPLEDPSGERYLEFWNLVFMQYNRTPDGKQLPLPKPSIDTGAGLERVASLLQGTETVFDTDLLRHLIAAVERRLGVAYSPGTNLKTTPAFRVIADHLRTLAFAIADGAQPSNVDRGYVLRKILRRAVRYGRQLKEIEEPFLADLLPALNEAMGADYPELVKAQGRIGELLTLEEETFQRTLKRGKTLLTNVMERAKENRQISGEDAFKLKDTYGFPLDEIQLIAKDADLVIDLPAFEELEKGARELSRKAHQTTQQVAGESLFASFLEKQGETTFVRETLKLPARITGIVVDSQFVDTLKEGQEAIILLDKTPFYAEKGGQVGDTGQLSAFTVRDTRVPFAGLVGHYGVLSRGTLKIGDEVQAEVNAERRQAIANNHTATHLLHWALHQVLGEQVKQAGSVVDDKRLRFDFNHHKPVIAEEITKLEKLVNEKIREDSPVETYEVDFQQVQSSGEIKQFFGDKYGKRVRVVDIDYSKELCGGTHTARVGTIGYFRIAKESSIAAGVRRIEAVTGAEADAFARESEQLLEQIASQLKVPTAKAAERIEKILEEVKQVRTELDQHKQEARKGTIRDLIHKARVLNGYSLISVALPVAPKELKVLADEVMDHFHKGVLVLAGTEGERCQVIIRCDKEAVAQGADAKSLVEVIAPIVKGKGGGKPDSAQVGGEAAHIEEALLAAETFLTKKLS